MKKIYLYFGIIISSFYSLKMASQSIEVLNRDFSEKIIKDGNNKMTLNFEQDDLQNLLILFNYNYTVEDILPILRLDREIIENKIETLVTNEYLKFRGGKYIPQIMIIPQEIGSDLYENSDAISAVIVDSIIHILPFIEKQYFKLNASEKYSFNELSFFLCSNILLDIGQLDNIENKFLKTKRTLRNGSRYYFSLLEKKEMGIEPFGLYGNQGLINNDTIYIGVYGNTRLSTNLDWRKYNKKKIPTFNKSDFHILLKEIPSLFTNSLVNILEENKKFFQKKYLELNYQESVSFEEFFIWWYHFIYTDVTNKLKEEGYIEIPDGSLFYYKIQKSGMS